MITSALISQLRREYGDNPKLTRVERDGNGSINQFNVGQFPIIENSYTVSVSGSTIAETTRYTLDKDSGDLYIFTTPSNGHAVRVQYKYAHWRDANWVEAINQAIEELNARGFFRQVARSTSAMTLSANVRHYSGPTNCIDLYELLESSDYTTSGTYKKLSCNWSYQNDANKVILGAKPTKANYLAVSYLRNMNTYSATSATLDVKTDWLEAVKKRAGAIFYRSLAGKVAKQGNANIDEGHFSFTNLRTMANDLESDFNNFALRKKPTRPAKDIQWHLEAGGVA